MSRRDLGALDTDILQGTLRLIQQAFKYGIDSDILQGGLLAGGTEQGIYEQSATQNYLIGTRLTTPDGRSFRYAKATNIISDHTFGLKFWNELADGIAYTAPLQVQAIGDTTILVDSGKGAAGVAVNEFAGGYVIVHTHTDYDGQFRRIISNTVADASGYVTLTVEAGWTKDIEVGYGVEVLQNPYSSVRLCSSGGGAGGTPNEYTSVAGMALVNTLVANVFLWLQTWGPCWINPHGTAAATVTADRRGLVFDREGSISAIDESVSADVCQQYAGFIINRESVGNGTGPPLFMLQICP